MWAKSADGPRAGLPASRPRSAYRTLDIYGFGTQREKYFSLPRPEKEGSQHLYRSEYRWLLGLEKRFPGRVRVWP